MTTKRRKNLLVVTDKQELALATLQVTFRKGYTASLVPDLKRAHQNVDFNPKVHAVIIDIPLDREELFTQLVGLRRKLPVAVELYVCRHRKHSDDLKPVLENEEIRALEATLDDPEAVFREIEEPTKQKKSFTYDVNIINCFIRSTCEVIEYYTGESPQLEKPTLKSEKNATPGYVTGLTELDGPKLRGSTSLTCDKNFITFLASRVAGVSRREAQRNDEMIESIASEMCDQIFGKARILLQEHGYRFQVGMPNITLSSREDVAHRAANPVMMIPFFMTKKTFCIEFCLEVCLDESG